MAHITKVIDRISRWLSGSFPDVLPIADVLDDVHVTERDIAEDLSYGRDD